jgi:4-hydroxy-3-polyprenylbenzoate decarboxylase
MDQPQLILALTGASGAKMVQVLLERSKWPVTLIVTKWGQAVFEHECGEYSQIASKAAQVYKNDDFWAPPASGSVPTKGMVIAPCSANTLAKIAAGMGDNLVTRAAYCHLKQRRPLILVLREAPLTTIDLENAARVSAAGGIIMPLTPPFYMFAGQSSKKTTLFDLLNALADRILFLLGQRLPANWETIHTKNSDL